MALIAAVNIIFPSINGGLIWWQVLLAVVCFTVGVILIDGSVAFVARWILPHGWFERGSKLTRIRPFEKKLYTALGVRKWKESVPELGGFTGFHKDKIYSPNDNDYVARYIFEANAGAFGHALGMLFGFLIVAVEPQSFLWISLPVAVVNFVLSAMPTMVLRYNVPKLETLYKLNEKKSASK